ncbi:MAG TPA: aldo/keto reductase [Candidatus Limnocylindria bacterium]|nr:aldo/keto reductase [Candidatus Limnocylindria bacterium]
MGGSFDLPACRLGLGLAAVGRPAYITLGRERDLGTDRSAEAMYARASAVLDAAWRAGVRYVDAARSYGRAEEFLARWMDERAIPCGELVVGSKWGYRYTAGWRMDAAEHEHKELSLERFRSQLAESKALLGDRLALYQIHSATLESGCLDDQRLLAALVEARERGAYGGIGLTLTGDGSRATLERALEARVGGTRVFDAVQATFNLLEPSIAGGLRAAAAAGLRVIAKEVFANGRLTPANDRPSDAPLAATLAGVAKRAGMAVDQLAAAWVLAHPFVHVTLSGAATPAQVASHAGALDRAIPEECMDELARLAEPPARYWKERASLPWA